jgi:hypothetical protein
VAEEDAQRGDRWSLKISAVPGITKIRRVTAEHERRLDQLLRKVGLHVEQAGRCIDRV